MKKKAIIALAALLTFGQPAWAQTTSFTETEDEKGTKVKPFLIDNIEELNALADDVNSGTAYSGVYFQLTDDLDYSSVPLFDSDNDGHEDSNFTPIGMGEELGEVDKPFKGIFDGNNKTISGITCTDDAGVGIGLFGYISGALIQNVKMENCSFTGNSCVGAIVGHASGVHDGAHGIFNCTVGSDVTVTAASFLIESMEEPGTNVLVPGTFAGGIIGDCGNTSLSGCTSAATVTGDDFVGGIAGRLISSRKDNKELGVIEDCFFTGSVVTESKNKGFIAGARGSVMGEEGTEGSIKLTLYNDDSDAIKNATRLSYYNAIEDVDVTLSGRTLSKSQWNTLCLPFSMDATQIAASSLNGATIKELDAENSNLAANGILTLKFADASSITAGKPYIVKWVSGDDISDPVFKGVTIDEMAPAAVTFTNNANDYGVCEFVGQYSPFSITDGNKNEIIMLGSGSKLGYSNNTRTLKCFRAHFYVPANGGGTLARAFVMDFGDGETTGIIGATADQRSASATYTLDGCHINGQPTQKGMYIQNGRKVIIK